MERHGKRPKEKDRAEERKQEEAKCKRKQPGTVKIKGGNL